ncbi:MAG: DNA-directed RNA polymerase subunit omega [Gammaproteobacteria bacterium]|nr:DNA-directed RNA polymerase subunit omega [Gammaproteobacteria bacterium]NIN62377.1 DNA-directed RNA polymerase subunit omega [Gammaproteobacteria bacterium]NIO61431.1 DNA-directed RNA polymerase subunit omega [Gammaproteobacteria bacterium]NIP49854.1 DNA-directed RNA polymerase subunit omega [Gammaproteobacteria bacterium]NIQ11887.1 DNA-directed RNA polymerase subunit omega [Gammaproteobacteria bacterium]
MARLTVEDCLEYVDNRYDLVILAARRARHIVFGSEPLVEEENDKPTVLALREIADGLVTSENIDKINKPEDLLDDLEGEESINFPENE